MSFFLSLYRMSTVPHPLQKDSGKFDRNTNEIKTKLVKVAKRLYFLKNPSIIIALSLFGRKTD